MDNIDQFVGFWLKDIPYLFFKHSNLFSDEEDWKNYGRAYILPTKFHNNLKRETRVELPGERMALVYPLSEFEGKICESYFFRTDRIYSTGLEELDVRKLKRKPPPDIRINGDKIYIPAAILKKENVYNHIINYIMVPPTKFNKFNKKMVQERYIPKTKSLSPIIHVPYVHSEGGMWDQLSSGVNWAAEDHPKKIITALHWLLKGSHKSIYIPPVDNFTKQFSHIYYETNREFSCTSVDSRVDPDYLKTCLFLYDKIIFFMTGHITGNIFSHSFLMLVNISNRNVYIIDPNGSSMYFSENKRNFDKCMDEIMKCAYLPADMYKWTYHMPNIVCPSFSFQRLEAYENIAKHGFCLSWSLWIVSLLVLNPGRDVEYLVRKAIQKIASHDPEFTTFIVTFSKEILDVMNNGEFEDLNITLKSEKNLLLEKEKVKNIDLEKIFDRKKEGGGFALVLKKGKSLELNQIKAVYSLYENSSIYPIRTGRRTGFIVVK